MAGDWWSRIIQRPNPEFFPWTHTQTHTCRHTQKSLSTGSYKQVNHFLPQVYPHCSWTACLFFFQPASDNVITVTFTKCKLLYCDCNFICMKPMLWSFFFCIAICRLHQSIHQGRYCFNATQISALMLA